jgi:hypothetical protein
MENTAVEINLAATMHLYRSAYYGFAMHATAAILHATT